MSYRMMLVEDLPAEANRMRMVMWVCDSGHRGTALFGTTPVCAECCHGGSLRHPLMCSRCGATSDGPSSH